MVFAIFLTAAIIVIFAAIQLNKYGDVINQKSTWNGAMVGTFLIGGATSLPELTTSLTAVYIDNPDIAVGNMLGSNVFNILILMAFDFIYRQRKVFNQIEVSSHLPIANTGFAMTGLLVVAILWDHSPSFLSVGGEMYLLIFIYLIVMKKLDGEEEEVEQTSSLSLKQGIFRFTLAALTVFIAGSVLTITGDMIAQQTGMNASFVGSFLIAASTSLPELVTVLAAFQMMKYSLAIGSILGSNIFNLQLLVVTDIFYREASILNASSTSNLTTALLGLAMMALTIYILLRPSVKRMITYALPSAATIILYFIASYVMF
ncbi:Na+/Ca2+ antiporter family protein [Gracilibacillus halophilus YIM-C55.5]|uniref:Na+/Ca2+ antiporter family protein n=1 Tax=Gracilibacillus halophilus YIM-C55.5 TaxID=1308866 RepID=N4WPL1_9BACI|nr:sodium:calcium antiporter [Gracilibacillus halophilus]ENH98042.1 Na+/Ca2+ antiporter family protein [Gracilibacillus halophilus YIM-C55.5]